MRNIEPCSEIQLLKKLLAQDIKTKDGEFKLSKERKNPHPVFEYNKALDTIAMVMGWSVIATTTITSDTLHHHVFDMASQCWQRRPTRRKPFIKVKMRVDK